MEAYFWVQVVRGDSALDFQGAHKVRGVDMCLAGQWAFPPQQVRVILHLFVIAHTFDPPEDIDTRLV